MKHLFSLFVRTLVFTLFLGCGYAPHKDPPTYIYDTPRLAEESARLHARDIGGTYEQNLCCGSMEPLIYSGDWVVIQPTVYGDHLLGKVGVYTPKWNDGKPVMHRFVSGNAKDGFIASGDHNPKSESAERVTAANYKGELMGIYRYQR